MGAAPPLPSDCNLHSARQSGTQQALPWGSPVTQNT